MNATTNVTVLNKTAPRQEISLIDSGLVSKEIFQALHSNINYSMYPLTFVGFVFCVFGAVVYSTKSMRSPTSLYLVALNLSELGNVVISILQETLGVMYGQKATSTYVYLTVQLYFSIYLGAAVRRTTYCLTCLLSAERCIAVVFPLKSKHFKIVKNPVITVMCVTTASIIFHVFVAIKFNVVSYQSLITNETLWKFQFTDFYLTNKLEYEAWSISSKVVFVYTSLLGCLILNFIVVITLRRHSKAREDIVATNIPRINDLRITVTVLVSTFLLVIFALPSNVSSLLQNTLSGYGTNTKEHYLYHTIMRIGKLCELISNCVGFIVYMTLSSQFRKVFLKIFCQCCGRKSPDNGMKTTSLHSENTNLSIVSKF
ncbi:hypothetical protein SNE40_015769 [Patella caerulea]|uniref:G-protein coupled receptors family 1 profile domain-containing protein n=1 Tax=Patella caerulea TaxID=87958 RepID=A0AAN8JMV8_PATCE